MNLSTPLLLGRVAAAALLAAAGGVSWRAAGVATDLAARHERAATLMAAGPEDEAPGRQVLALVKEAIDADAGVHGAIDAYWRRDYERLRPGGRASVADTAEALLIAANAAFREAQREAATTPPGPDRLDQVMQAYAAVLRSAGFDRDAAYNYEYLARLRDAAARPKPGAERRAPAPGPMPARADGLPSGPTIHGRPGRHPAPARAEDFEVITPMDYGDREAQPEPTPGRKLPRKG
jgi:hypothetical protein